MKIWKLKWNLFSGNENKNGKTFSGGTSVETDIPLPAHIDFSF
jgi:hypothetical protein